MEQATGVTGSESVGTAQQVKERRDGCGTGALTGRSPEGYLFIMTGEGAGPSALPSVSRQSGGSLLPNDVTSR